MRGPGRRAVLAGTKSLTAIAVRAAETLAAVLTALGGPRREPTGPSHRTPAGARAAPWPWTARPSVAPAAPTTTAGKVTPERVHGVTSLTAQQADGPEIAHHVHKHSGIENKIRHVHHVAPENASE